MVSAFILVSKKQFRARSSAGRAFGSHPRGRGFESLRIHQKSTGFDLSIFYPLRKQWYIITRKRASHHRRCISSAAGCISFRNDDIQNFVLMICNSCGIDDIHGFRRDLCKSSNLYAKLPAIFRTAVEKSPD